MLRTILRQIVLGLAILSASLNVSTTAAQAANLPTLPNIPDISCSASTGITTNVPAGGDLQGAINSALPGDIITLAAGATYTGSFTLPNKPGSSCITIRTSAPNSALPPPGTRITPAYASVLPKIVSPGLNAPALQTATSAHHFQFIGVEIIQANDGVALDTLMQIGWGDSSQTALSQVPHHFVFDRVYIHGLPTGQIKHCLTINSASTTVINSYISDCKVA